MRRISLAAGLLAAATVAAPLPAQANEYRETNYYYAAGAIAAAMCAAWEGRLSASKSVDIALDVLNDAGISYSIIKAPGLSNVARGIAKTKCPSAYNRHFYGNATPASVY